MGYGFPLDFVGGMLAGIALTFMVTVIYTALISTKRADKQARDKFNNYPD